MQVILDLDITQMDWRQVQESICYVPGVDVSNASFVLIYVTKVLESELAYDATGIKITGARIGSKENVIEGYRFLQKP